MSIALKIPFLSARPMLLAYIPDIVASDENITSTSQLYEIMVDAWLERETAWVNKSELRDFSEYLAAEIFMSREDRGMEKIPYKELPSLAEKWKIQLRQWQIRGRSLLNRDAQGNYKFAHRSIMEYFFVVGLLKGNELQYGTNLTDQMKEYLIEILGEEYPGILKLRRFLLNVDLAVQSLDKAPFSRVGRSYDRIIYLINHLSSFSIYQVDTRDYGGTVSSEIFIVKTQEQEACKDVVIRYDPDNAYQARIEIDKGEGIFVSRGTANRLKYDTFYLELDDVLMGNNLHPDIVRFILKHGARNIRLMAYMNNSSDLKLYPVSPNYDRFMLYLPPVGTHKV